MPKELEERLKAEAAAKGYTGERADRYVYGTMEKIKQLAKGQARTRAERQASGERKAKASEHRD